MKFRGRIENTQLVFDRQAVAAACRKYPQFIIEVRKYDAAKEISTAQMAYWHAVPVEEYAAYTGLSKWKAEQWLKRECGEEFFMKDISVAEEKAGTIMFECQNSYCRELFVLPKKNEHGVLLCPNPTCLSENVKLFFMLSKTKLSTKDFNQVLENTYDYMASINRPIMPPDKNWRENQDKERVE